MADKGLSATELVARLIAFDTTSRKSNLALIDFVRDYLDSFGVASTLIHDESGAKANLFATIGPEQGGVVLSGHSDVVPIDGQDWSSDPFTLRRDGGRLYGRGTADMKSFIACALAMVPEFTARPLAKPVHFAFSYDEEVGCLGVHGIVGHIAHRAVSPELVIVGEPTEMTVVNAHKGCCAIRTTVTGLEAHSSATDAGVNAVMYAAELIGFVGRLAEEMKTRPAADGRFKPPYTTVHVGTVAGGTALNIIPKECSFVWEYRALPGVDGGEIVDRFAAFAEAEVLPRMRAVHPGAAIVTEVRGSVPPLNAEHGSPAEALVMALAGSNRTGAVSYTTEAGIFQSDGTPAVVCGPGNIAQAHKPDEFIEASEIDACTTFLRALLDRVLAA